MKWIVWHLYVQGSVRALLHEKIRDAYTHPQFITDVMKPMQIESIIDQDVRLYKATFSFRWKPSIDFETCWFKMFLLPSQVQNLSGGELQRVALTLCLGKPADVYLIDEPSAYLDSEQRLMAARVIKRFFSFSSLFPAITSSTSTPSSPNLFLQLWQHPFCVCVYRYILHAKKTAFVVEHDFIMATYLADRVIVFDGIPSKKTSANA